VVIAEIIEPIVIVEKFLEVLKFHVAIILADFL
jgi:hypothetical protein